jgi:hypothetical protein
MLLYLKDKPTPSGHINDQSLMNGRQRKSLTVSILKININDSAYYLCDIANIL